MSGNNVDHNVFYFYMFVLLRNQISEYFFLSFLGFNVMCQVYFAGNSVL